MKHIISTAFLITLFCGAAFGQRRDTIIRTPGITDKINVENDRGPSVNALEKEAGKLYREGDYYSAMQLYGRALEPDTFNVRALEGYANAAYDFHSLKSADWAYAFMMKHNLGKPDQSTLLRLADVKYRQGKYLEAKELYHQYLFKTPPAEPIAADMDFAQERLERCDWAIALLREADMQVVTVPLDTLINTQYAEYAPRWFEDKLYFSSYRFLFEKDKERPKRQLIQMMNVDNPGVDAVPQVNRLDFNNPDKLSAYAAFSADGQRMYHCECEYTAAAFYRCDLYRRNRNGQDWGPAEKLPEGINNPDFTSTEPAVGKLSDGREVLFFVSDRPGKGGRDIWYSVISGNDFSAPINATVINTDKDDVTPFFHDPTQTLYFSTMGLITLGGFDIYKSEYKNNTWLAPKHTGAELNSAANDVYFSLNPSGRTGFVCSNRNGAINYSEEACCYDIFKVDISKPEMIAINFNKLSGDSLPETTMRLLTMENGRPVEEVKLKVSESLQAFKLAPGKNYKLITEKARYISDTTVFSTPKTIWEERLVKKLYLEPNGVQLIVTVFDKETQVPLMGTTGRLDQLTTTLANGVTKSGTDSAPLLTEQMTKATTNRYEYILDLESNYNITGTKPGYTTGTDKVSTVGLTKSTVIERKLYLTRGVDFEALAFDELLNEPLNGVTFRLVNVDDKKSTSKTNTDANNFTSILDFDYRYKIVASKEDYYPDSLEFNTLDLLDEPFHKIVRELRLTPRNYLRFLPTVLYFDNAIPGPVSATQKEITNERYADLYTGYYQKRNIYINGYTNNMKSPTAKGDSMVIASFFDDSLKRDGWERLLILTEQMNDALDRGISVQITLKGFASPLGNAEYNRLLTNRRVVSVKNHFRRYGLGKYMDNGLLEIILEPNGSSKAPKTVSGKPEDRKNSVYAVPASRERRVEIIGIDIKEKTTSNQ